MAYIQAELTKEEDADLKAAAEIEGRSKKQQLKYGALVHARAILDQFEDNPVPHNEDATEGGEA